MYRVETLTSPTPHSDAAYEQPSAVESPEEELARLEDELAVLEDQHDFEKGPPGPEIEKLIERIAELSRELEAETVEPPQPKPVQAIDPARINDRIEARLDGHVDIHARERARASKQRRRQKQLRAEWEQWRYRRSKLPPEERGPMLTIGERECRYCGGAFPVTDLRQRYCPDTSCRQLHHKTKAGGT